MDIAGLSTSISQSNLSTNVSLAVMNMAKDTMAKAGEQIVEMIDTSSLELSVNPNIGSNIDLKI